MITLAAQRQTPTRQEGGSVILIVLVLMMVLATIGLQSMSSTSLQEKMTSNTMEENVAFQTAETALRTGEAWIEAQAGRPTAVSTCSTPPCNVWSQGSISYSSYYVNSSWWTTNARPYDNSTNTSRYIIEQLSDTVKDSSGTGQSVAIGTGAAGSTSTTIYYYRITARGVGNSGTSTIVVQSIYARAY